MSESPPPPSEPELPVLTPEVVADDDALEEAVDHFIEMNVEAQEHLREIATYYAAVRDAVDSGVWRLVVNADNVASERWSAIGVAIVRWAFDAGRRFPIVANEDGAS